MISHMDKIYANAFFTIIAAAGDDAQTGLPGVTKLHRRRQHGIRVRDVTLLELPNSHDDVYSSTWASRGWTYQECYFSTRRLLFTANEVLFLCNGFFVRESLNKQEHWNWHLEGFRRLIPQFDSSGRGFSVHGLKDHIQHYSARKLSYDSDSLNAILGVLNYYGRGSAKLTTRILHLSWGLTADQDSDRPHVWNVHLLWYHRNPTARRPEFPSWAWTGWNGPVDYDTEGRLELGDKWEWGQRVTAFDWKVSFEMRDHSEVDITRFASAVLKQIRKGKYLSIKLCPKQLSISCLVLRGHSHRFELPGDEKSKWTKVSTLDGRYVHRVSHYLRNDSLVVLHMWEGVNVCVEAQYDQLLEHQESLLGLLVGYVPGYQLINRPPYELKCLLVRPRDDGYYERVGLTCDLPPYTYAGRGIFLNHSGNIMDEFVLPGWYPDAAEKKTIHLV